jgi:hypothetical protein
MNGLADEDTNQVVTDIHLECISRTCCKQWKSLPSHLGLEDIVAEDIDKSQKTEREKRHEFLRQWKSTKGSEATYKRLIDALLQIRCKQDAEKVQEMLIESISQPQRPTQDKATAASNSTSVTALSSTGN